MAVQAKFAWPSKKTEIEYSGHTFLLNPETEDLAQSVSVEYAERADIHSVRKLVHRFLSALSWAEGAGVSELFSIGSGGTVPPRVGKSNTKFITHQFRADYLPLPKDEKTTLALALYREALSVNSPPYSFLGFFKIFNILFSSGKAQIDWINAHIDRIDDVTAKKRLAEIQTSNPDIGNYLYVQGRCAVAHAFGKPIVDPDEPEDIMRLSEDIHLIKNLASIAIQEELGIISTRSFYSSHLYELEGFVDILGKDIVEMLAKGKKIPEERQIKLPHISIRLRDHAPFQSYENLEPLSLKQDGSFLVLYLQSQDKIMHAVIIMDFKNWRIVFDPTEHVAIIDDGSPQPFLIQNQTVLFAKGKYLNGEIEVYDYASGKLLARADPFIPTNIDIASTAKNMDKIAAQALEMAEKRETPDA